MIRKALSCASLGSVLVFAGNTPALAQAMDASTTLPNAKAGECYAKVIIPAQYKTETVDVVQKEASERIEIVQAKYEWVTERVLIQQSSFKLEPVPATYSTVEERVEVRPQYSEWRLGSGKSAKKASLSLLAGAQSAGLSTQNARPGQCYAEYFQPARYRTETVRVVKKEAAERIEVTPPKYQWNEQRVMVKEASTKVVETPAVYATVSEKVLVSPATTVWKKGTGLVQRIDNTTGEIMCLVEVPAKYKTVTKRVVKAPASSKVVQIPAEYKTERVRKLVAPAQERRVPLPAEFETVTKRVQISEEKVGWYLSTAAPSASGKPTGRKLCLQEIPAEFKTVEKRVVKSPARTKRVEIPAQYKTVKKRKLIAPASQKRIPVPAVKQTVTKRQKIADEKLEWKPVLCETNMSKGLITEIQRALTREGFSPGPSDGVIGRGTMAAIDNYQLKNNLARGGLTMATLKALGVTVGN